MKKLEFLSKLHNKLCGFPQDDVQERLEFYSEMIEDRMEEGLSEEAAVAQIGSVDEIASQIIADTPLSRLIKQRIKPKTRFKAWEIVLLAVGAPLWLPLLIAAFSVLLSLYVTLWAVAISLWAVFVSVGVYALGSIAGGIIIATGDHQLSGIAMIGLGILCAGLTIFLFYGCKAVTKGTLWLSKKIALGIKYCFVKKEGAS